MSGFSFNLNFSINICFQSHWTELPAETKEKWDAFVSGTLADLNKQNTVELVSYSFHLCCNFNKLKEANDVNL